MSEPLTTLAALSRALRGPLSFLRPDAEEIYRLMPEVAPSLPMPQKIFLTDESATPLLGFPILVSRDLKALKEALATYVRAEEEVQVRILRRQSHDAAAHQAAWEGYRSLFSRATDNVTTSSYGRNFPDIFWLYHSLDVARLFKDSPRRIVRHDLHLGKKQGGELKYKVFHKYLDRVLSLTYDAVHRLAGDTEELEPEIFPAVLSRMRDNVLVLTEDHISPDLGELSHYFDSYLKIDGRDLRYRLAKALDWHAARLQRDPQLRVTIRHLLDADPDGDPRDLLRRPGYLTLLAALPGYDQEGLLRPDQVDVWERLLLKLKEFELFQSLRRLIVPLQQAADGRLAFQERSLNRTWAGPSLVEVSPATRPLDFMQPWVIDPQVDRYGMIYDITDFSHTVSLLRRSGKVDQDRSFRQMFRFQRRINRLAGSNRLKLEKYLGDGAFYSSREAPRMLPIAIQVQRAYRQALEEGFPFDRGLRIALNFGTYRLLPIDPAGPGETERYEFFGHGVVELSRLTTGKAMREIEEIKILLLNLGYPELSVHRFFAPLSDTASDVVDKQEESRPFFAYVNRNGKLVNEGIVATERFIEHYAQERPPRSLYLVREEGRTYVAVPLEIGDSKSWVGLRKLGMAGLKGLDPVPVYEVVDGAHFDGAAVQGLRDEGLMQALERVYAAGLGEAIQA
ncbi:MAG TPA: hypothetical protein VMT16_16920 [Thermoanaerobaculia bacterium]|nr:hypothetical protein [Thermoanaerobaculia bacterium]